MTTLSCYDDVRAWKFLFLKVRYRTDKSLARLLKSKKECSRRGAKMQTPRPSDEQSSVVVIDFRRCNSRQLSEIYQDFGSQCARREVRRALFTTGDEEAVAHYALRDILRTLALIAEIPLHLRLALVTSSDSVAQVCRTMQEELRALGCDARSFRIERQADDWLRAGNGPAQAPDGEEAILH